MTMQFPETWPANCPPPDAVDASGKVFRVVRNDPPVADDLASHSETGKLLNAPACLRCGLSTFRDFRDAVHQRLLLPKLGDWIAHATLAEEHGKTKLTSGKQPTHTTWWAYEGVNRASLFSVMSEES
jgi:hypothetical protein